MKKLLSLVLLSCVGILLYAQNGAKIETGQKLPNFEATDIWGRRITPATFQGKRTLVAFMRNVDCAMCNLRIHELRMDATIRDTTKLQVILFLQSPQSYILKSVKNVDNLPPFYIVADPDMVQYKKFGAKFSAFGNAVGMLRLRRVLRASALNIALNMRHSGDSRLMPFELLVNPDGSVYKAYYGSDQGDHLPVETIYSFIKATKLPAK